MAITRGTTPTLRTYISKAEVPSIGSISHVYMTFSQKGTQVAGLTRTLSPSDDEISDIGDYILIAIQLTQTQTLALAADEDLICVIDVTFVTQVTDGTHTERKRATSKKYAVAVCDGELDEVLN